MRKATKEAKEKGKGDGAGRSSRQTRTPCVSSQAFPDASWGDVSLMLATRLYKNSYQIICETEIVIWKRKPQIRKPNNRIRD